MSASGGTPTGATRSLPPGPPDPRSRSPIFPRGKPGAGKLARQVWRSGQGKRTRRKTGTAPLVDSYLLTDQAGFPLMVHAFEGNMAETKTMLPAIEAFMAAHQLPDVTIVADAGMISEASQKDIEEARLSFILGMKIPFLPYAVKQWKSQNPGQDIPDGHIFTQPRPGGPTGKLRDQVIYYQYKADRARRTLRGIDEQVAKAEKAVAGKAPVKRNRFIQLDDAAKSVNRELEAKARELAGLKGYADVVVMPRTGWPVLAGIGCRAA